MQNINFLKMSHLLSRRPKAWAKINGSELYEKIKGFVGFYPGNGGVLAVSEFWGLPTSDVQCDEPIFGMHIHEGNSCTGSEDDPFENVGSHYNPYRCPHPYHAGDMLPIFGADGCGFSAFFTDRFTIDEIIGKTVILHLSPDDFHTQPAGNSGKKIACGIIRK